MFRLFARRNGLETRSAAPAPAPVIAEPTLAAEVRSAGLDVGAIYSQLFQLGIGGSYSWSTSPAILASALSTDGGGTTIIVESRRISRVSPLLHAYQRCMTGAILTGDPERPEFPETVPERVATAAADLWEAAHQPEVERDLLHRVIVDGELLLLDDGTVVPGDAFEPVMAGPEWARTVASYKIGKSAYGRSGGIFYIGDRRQYDVRALPWIAQALPPASALVSIRTAAAHGLASLAKISGIVKNTAPDRITAAAGARTGVVGGDPDNTAGREPITSVGLGSVPFMRPGEEIARIAAGPDEQSRKYEAQLERDIATGLNLPLSELMSSYESGSFSNLRMAHSDAGREYDRRRQWWHRAYRLPMWLAILSDAFANGDMPRMSRDDLAALRKPTWPGPKREVPQPEKQAAALGLLVDKGIIDAATAAAQLET